MKILQLNEVRKAYFLQSFNRNVEDMRIISFGRCNYQCPYCKRDGNFITENGNIISSYNVEMEEIKHLIDSAIIRGQRIRLSGGDPCCFQNESLEIARYVWETYQQKISIAHNGSSLPFVTKILPYLEYAAIDLKSLKRLNEITGFRARSLDSALKIITLLSKNNVLVDVRTPIFKDTTKEEILAIAEMLPKENVFYTLRKYNEVAGCTLEEPRSSYVRDIVDYIKSLHPTIKIGCRDKWSGCSFYVA